MGRRRNSLLDVMATWPWYINAAVGGLGFATLRWLLPAWRQPVTAPTGDILLQILAQPVFAWAWLAICMLATLLSLAGAYKRRQLLDTRTGLESLATTGWRNFELLVGEAFRRQGYAVEETGLGGADGGIDLILRRNGKRTLVQCKQWRRQQVGVTVVRELYGLLAHHKADAAMVVSSGKFSRDAQAFVAGKPVALVPGAELLRMIREVQTRPITEPLERLEPTLATPTQAATAATCRKCAAPLVERKNRTTGEVFLGCSRFPACRG